MAAIPKNDVLFQDLFSNYVKAFLEKNKKICPDDVTVNWKSMKNGKEVDLEAYNKLYSDLKCKSEKRKLTSFFKQPHANTSKKSLVFEDPLTMVEHPAEVIVENNMNNNENPDEETPSSHEKVFSYSCPALDKANNELSKLNEKIDALQNAKNMYLSCDESQPQLVKEMENVKGKKKVVVSKIKRLKTLKKTSAKYRNKKKSMLIKIAHEFPELATSVKVRNGPGKPPLEEQYPDLPMDILKIATIGAAVSERRRDEMFRSVKTLDDLHSEPSKLNYKISRTALYYRLEAKNLNRKDGKRHVHTVPVR